ncbi:DoxX family protein [Corynebacterium aquilae]|uniref:Membrane protein n=1 Tax=Corynebacterium aquilae DSM 44791 TaxID=1431546 RepID=A0A1L7CEU5_9CORY|nr:DoxX family protein [Corynebacterium aquilae]APT84355.1 membrane protein [Corynebacterium aquilae DSM 44791]
MDKPVVRDSALLFLRLVVGFVFVFHGCMVFFGHGGVDATAADFAANGVPQPHLSAYIAGVSQILGGACLLIGVLTTFAAGALALFMMCAMYFVHGEHGFFVGDNGLEYPLVLTTALLMIVVFGAGRASLDEVLSR